MPDLSPWVRVIAVINQNNHTHPTSLARINTFAANDDDATAATRRLINREAAARHPLPNLSATKTVGHVPLPANIIDLITELTDPDECTPDSLGGCVTHTMPAATLGPNGCPHRQAHRLIAAYQEATTKGRPA